MQQEMLNSSEATATEMPESSSYNGTMVSSGGDGVPHNGTHHALQVPMYQLKIVYYTIGSVGMLGNLLVLYVIGRSAKMRAKITNMYILNQSTADFLGSFFMVVTSLYQEPDRRLHGLTDEVYCRLWLTKWQMWAMFTVSTYNLMLITVERYLAVVHAVWHKISFTQLQAVVSMVVVWLLGMFYMGAYMIFPTVIDNGMCSLFSNWVSPQAQSGTGIMNFLVLFLIPIFIFAFCYGRMTLVLRNRIHPTGQSGMMTRAMRNVIKTFALVNLCFVLCWSWNQIYYLMFTLGYQADFTGSFYHFTVIATFCNCCINPFIYVFKYESFQASLYHAFPWLPRLTCTVRVGGRPGLTTSHVSTHGQNHQSGHTWTTAANTGNASNTGNTRNTRNAANTRNTCNASSSCNTGITSIFVTQVTRLSRPTHDQLSAVSHVAGTATNAMGT